jgi:hypothetical protein
MLERIYGTVTVQTDRLSSKMNVPMKSNPTSQLKSFLIVIEQALKANGDKQLIDDFCKTIQKIDLKNEVENV